MERARILVVEDERLVADSIKNCLEDLGYEVLSTAETAEEAIQRAKEYRPDLVLMDISLPGSMDGIEAAQEIQSHHNAPVVYLTAYADDEILDRAKATSAYGYILKPYKDKELHSVIQMALCRQNMETKLRESEEKYRILFEALPQKIFYKDYNSVYLACNENYARDLGIMPDQVRGKTDYAFYSHTAAEKYRADDKRILSSGETESIEEEYCCGGEEIWVQTVKTPIKNENGNLNGLLGIFWDISERKRTEDELRRYREKLEELVDERTIELRGINQRLEEEIAERNEIEKSLRDSERRYRLLAETTSDVIWTTDLKLKGTYVSPSIVQLRGYTPQEAMSQRMEEIFTPASLERAKKIYAEELAGEAIKKLGRRWSRTFDLEMTRKDGTTVWTETQFNAVIDQDDRPTGVMGIARDITERKRAEEFAIRKKAVSNAVSQVLERALSCETAEELARTCLAEAMQLTDSPSGLIDDLEEGTGALAPSFLQDQGRRISTAEHDQDHALLHRLHTGDYLSRLIQDGASIIVNEPFLGAKHEQSEEVARSPRAFLAVPVHHRDKTIGILALAHKKGGYNRADQEALESLAKAFALALDRKRTEEALRERERLYRSLIEASPDAIVLIDLAGNIITASPQAALMFRFSSVEDGTARNALDFISEEDQARAHNHMRQVLEQGRTTDIEHRLKKKDGTLFWAELSTSLIVNSKQEPWAVTAIIKDVTKRKKAEERLCKSEARLAEAQRIAHLGNWDWNIETNELFWSDEVYSIFGLPPGQFGTNQESFLSSVHHEDRQSVRDWVCQALKREGPYSIDYRIILPDGSERVVHEEAEVTFDEVGSPIRMACTVHDITAHKEAEKRILWQNALLTGIKNVFEKTLVCESEEQIANICLNVAEQLTGSKFGFVGEVNEKGLFDPLALSDPGWDACKIRKSNAVAAIRNMEIRGIWGRVLKDEKSIIVNDPASHPDSIGTPEGHLAITSFLGVPLKHKNKTIGMIALGNKEHGYLLTDVEAVETLSVSFVEALMRKRAEVAQRESEKRFRELAELLPETIFECDVAGNLTFVNRKAFDIFGYAEKDFDDGLNALNMIVPEDRDLAMETIQKALNGEDAGLREYRGVRKNRSAFPIMIHSSAILREGSPVGLRGFIIDITERKQAEQALKESEKRYKTLFEGAAEGILVVDVETQSFRYANRAMCDMLGCGKEEISRLTVADLYPKDSPLHAVAQFEAKKGSERRLASNIPCQRKDGSVFFADICTTPMELDGRRCSVGFLTDVTERREFERTLDAERAEREKMELDLRHAQKLEAVGQLAAGIAHEINTPTQFVGDSIHFLKEAFEDLRELIAKYQQAVSDLGGIQGHEELLEEIKTARETADLEYLEEHVPGSLETCSDGISRISSIVRSMKEFAHPDSRDKSFADLNLALMNTLTISRNEYKYVADVETELAELPQVKCHLGDLNQVFLNIIVNAGHAIADVVGDSGDKGLLRVLTAHEGDAIRIEFEDTGSGIPAAIRDRIFDPFFTTKEVGKGSGQGLAIARSIVVDKHNGSLTCDSVEGRGSTFTIRLPVDEGSNGGPEEVKA